MAWALVHDLAVHFPGQAGQLALGAQLGKLRLVVCVGNGAGAQAVAETEGDVVGAHDFAHLAEMGVKEILLVMGQAPLGQERAAARDDAGDAPGRERDIAEEHAGVHGEVIHALLALFQQRVAIKLPGQVLRFAAGFFERLVNGDRADGHGRIAEDPFARFVDVPPGGQVHHGVGAPLGGPAHFLDLLLDARGHRAAADIGVDLHQEICPDNHRLGFGVIDVGRNDRAAAGHFRADEFGGDGPGDARAERLAAQAPQSACRPPRRRRQVVRARWP